MSDYDDIIVCSLFNMFWTPILTYGLQPGDIVAIKHGYNGRREGLVVGTHIDWAVRCSNNSPSHCMLTSNHRGDKSLKCSSNLEMSTLPGTYSQPTSDVPTSVYQLCTLGPLTSLASDAPTRSPNGRGSPLLRLDSAP